MKVRAGLGLMGTPVPGVNVNSWPIALDEEDGKTGANLSVFESFLMRERSEEK